MKRWTWPALLAGLLIVLLAGCSGPAAQPLAFNPAPWTAGEVSEYVLLDRSGAQIGTATWKWSRSSADWLQEYTTTVNGREDRGSVALDADLRPVRATREVGGVRYEASYLADEIRITTVAADGTATTKSLKPVADGIDNDASLQVQRALPLAAGYVTRYTDVIPTTGQTAAIQLSVTGAETVTVPAGAYATWRVEMSFGSGKHDAWYAQAAPYPLVKYVNRASGAAFELSSFGAGTAAPAPALTPIPAAATVATAEASSAATPLNIPLLLTTFLVQMPLMILFPLALGWWIRRKYGIGWGVFGIGALTFIASQVVHIPLNYALGLLTGGRGIGLWPLIPLALATGLSAGICEEGARWLVLRFFARKTRGWRAGLQFGAGHGGAEAIIFGALVLVNVVVLVALRTTSPSALGLQGVTADQSTAAQASFWGTAAYLPVVAGLERVFAIMLHIALATLVMRAVTRRQLLYLLAAVALHTAANAWAIWALKTAGMGITEGGVAVLALFCLWLIWRLREAPAAAEPEPASAPGGPARTAADLVARALTPEELARRAEASRYE